MGKYELGLHYAAPAYTHDPGKDITTIYAGLLQETGQLTQAKHVLEAAIKTGKGSVGMKAQLKTIYEGEKNTIPFDTYLASLEHQMPETSHQGISLINETAQPLKLTNLSGEPVDLAALKGKIVVLDFWATWCKPCIQSFPAMQQVMKQFPNVAFLYIATFEKGDALQNVSKFAKENAYRFQYLLDQKNNRDESFKAFTDFKVSGIPYKIVLDQKGNIRFRASGFNGNDDDLIRELSEVIHQLN
jgi:thiol-disulfide isomerase/thioredoxin